MAKENLFMRMARFMMVNGTWALEKVLEYILMSMAVPGLVSLRTMNFIMDLVLLLLV